MSTARIILTGFFVFSAGVLVGNLDINSVNAQESYPTEHKGISVEKLGVISKESIAKQTGLEGYVLQLRVATIAPGGLIARHNEGVQNSVSAHSLQADVIVQTIRVVDHQLG